MKEFVAKSVVAGVFISIGAAAFLSIGYPFGPLVFAFGLISVVLTQTLLFTGRSGFIVEKYWLLIPMLVLNGIGCWMVALLFDFDVSNIINSRTSMSWYILGGRSILTGAIMTVSVFYAKERGNWLPLLFGIPAFIIAGLPHCVADIFYYACAGFSIDLIIPWLVSVVGNFIGCNFHRILCIRLNPSSDQS